MDESETFVCCSWIIAHGMQVSIYEIKNKISHKHRGVDWCKIHDNVDSEEEASG